MKKILIAVALMPLSMGVKAEKPIRPVTDAVFDELNDYLQSNITFMGQPLKKDARTRDKQTLRVTRSVKDCIKPGGMIDDDVQMCVNGTREKTW